MGFRKEALYLLAITGLAAILVAASNVGPADGPPIVLLYLYWLVRFLIEGLIFVGIRELIEKVSPSSTPLVMETGLATLLSLAPFTLAITAFDIVLGFPELGLQSGSQAGSPKISEFGLELVYQLDNHVALCLLLTMPRIILAVNARTSAAAIMEPEEPRHEGFLDTLDPPLAGTVIWAEAQEHYVRLSTATESRMVLHRFSDILRDLPEHAGLRVHRSHWVALEAIATVGREGTNLRLVLHNGETVPVSRTYRQAVESALEDKLVVT